MGQRVRLLVASCAAIVGSSGLAGISVEALAQSANLRQVTVDGLGSSGSIRSLQGVDGLAKPILPGYPDLHAQFAEQAIDAVHIDNGYGVGEDDSSYLATDVAEGIGLVPPSETAIAAQVVRDYASPRVIFPNPGADPDDPRSYNFAATDAYVRDAVRSGQTFFFRFGRDANIGGILPDFARYADVAKHVVMHYEHGWDHGMLHAVQYYEVWNEPDLGTVNWNGTATQYYDFYTQVAKAVKAAVPEAHIGGPAAVTVADLASPYVDGFISYVTQHHVPLDFFSWHYLSNATLDPFDYERLGLSIRSLLDQNGLSNAQQFLTEWNDNINTATGTPQTQTTYQAAFVASALTYMQDAALDRAFYVRGDALDLGLFSAGGTFTPPARAVEALGLMNSTPTRLSTTGQDTIGFAVLAGRSADKRQVNVLISNYQRDPNYLNELASPIPEASLSLDLPASSPSALPFFGFKSPSLVDNLNPSLIAPDATLEIPPSLPLQTFNYINNQGYDLVINDLPWGSRPFVVARFRIDGSHNLSLVDASVGANGQVHLTATLPPPSVELIVVREI